MKKIKIFSITTLVILLSPTIHSIEPRGEMLAINRAKKYLRVPDKLLDIVRSGLQNDTIQAQNFPRSQENLPLFLAFPNLRDELPHISLGSFPTPVKKLERFGRALGLNNLYIKCDDQTGGILPDGHRLFGGNKVRKLEFLLADALYNGVSSVMTFGEAGSNHALATATYAQQLGLKGISILLPQTQSDIIKRNLSLGLYHDAELHLCNNRNIYHLCIAYTMLREKQLYGTLPYVIPVGGSCPTGTVGFVNAVFELKQQIEAGLLLEPDYIYATLGSMGTAAGLLLGIKAAGLKSKLIAVAVSNNPSWGKAVKLAQETNIFLNDADYSMPLFLFSGKDFEVLRDFVGEGYGKFTQEGINAMSLIKETEGITLDGVYTGKCLSGLVAQAPTHNSDDVILFWNTFCGDNFTEIVNSVDYKDLPICFHQYFEA